MILLFLVTYYHGTVNHTSTYNKNVCSWYLPINEWDISEICID